MAVKTDDLEAVRLVAETLQPFTVDDRKRIIRWAREKLGMAVAVVLVDIFNSNAQIVRVSGRLHSAPACLRRSFEAASVRGWRRDCSVEC